MRQTLFALLLIDANGEGMAHTHLTRPVGQTSQIDLQGGTCALVCVALSCDEAVEAARRGPVMPSLPKKWILQRPLEASQVFEVGSPHRRAHHRRGN